MSSLDYFEIKKSGNYYCVGCPTSYDEDERYYDINMSCTTPIECDVYFSHDSENWEKVEKELDPEGNCYKINFKLIEDKKLYIMFKNGDEYVYPSLTLGIDDGGYYLNRWLNVEFK